MELVIESGYAGCSVENLMKPLISLLLLAASSVAADAPFYVFDNGLGSTELSLDQQAELARQAGYAGIFYSGTKNIPSLLAACQSRGLRVLGIYTGMDMSKPNASYDPGLPEAIQQLNGTGALITFTVNGKAAGTDEIAVPVIRAVARMAAAAGLKVALYPHFGFYVARIEDALRLRQKAGAENVGLVFNLCHWLRSGDGNHLDERLTQALPYTFMVSVNGADPEGDWDRLIQPLDRGTYDVRGFVSKLRSMGYKGPFALQCYNVKGDRAENLTRSMNSWRKF